jgi:hypothetical protein
MNTGKLVRMNRIFSHASGALCSVAVVKTETNQATEGQP